MALLNLPPATGSRKSSRETGSLDGLAERMADLKREEEEERKRRLESQTLEQAKKEKERQQETKRKEAEQRARDNSLWGKVSAGVKDVFSADTDADKARRKAAGQPELYADQQAQKKKGAQTFKKDTADEFDRGKRLNFSKDEIDKRRDFYKSRGVNIDELVSDREAYNKLLGKYGGDTRKLAFARAKGKLSAEDKKLEAGAARYEKTLKGAEKAESTYQRNKKAEAGAENVLEQAERGFVRGAAEPIIKAPANIQAAVGAALQALAPHGSAVDRTGKRIYEAGAENLDALARRIIETGYGAQEADNPLVGGISQGAGSLLASMSAVGATGRTSAAAGMFGLEAGTGQLRGSKEAGKGEVQAFATGATAGVLEGLLEKVGLDKFLGAKGKPMKQVVTRMVTEATQEASQSLSQSGVRATYTDVDFGQAVQQALEEGGIGAIVGGGASLPLSISQSLEAKGVDPDTALEIGMNVQERVASVLEDSKVDIKPPAPEKPAQPRPVRKAPQKRPEESPDQFAHRYVKEAPEQTQKDYDDRIKKEFGVSKSNVVSADEAKFIIPGFKTEHSSAYHEAASGFAKGHYKKLLENPDTKTQDVLIMGGGAGAGKTSSLRTLQDGEVSLDGYAAVNDTNLTTMQSADVRIKPALESGRNVKIFYVYRDPIDAFVNGNIPRAKKTGRIVPIPAHVETHVDSLETIKKVYEQYKNDPRVEIQVADNSRGQGKAELVEFDFLTDKSYNKEELTKELLNELEKAKQQGQVTEEAYRTYKSGLQADEQRPGKQPEQKRQEKGPVEPKKPASPGEELVYQGGKPDTKTAFWTTRPGEALAYAQQRGINDGEIRVARWQDLPQDLRTDDAGNLLSLAEYQKQYGQHIAGAGSDTIKPIATIDVREVSPLASNEDVQKLVSDRISSTSSGQIKRLESEKRTTKPKKKVAKKKAAPKARQTTKYPDNLVEEYAEYIRDIEQGATGGQMIPDGEGGYKRTSEHSRFYRDHYAEHGKPPTKADYFDEAVRQIMRGKADKDFIAYANDMIAKPSATPALSNVVAKWKAKSGGGRQTALDALADYDTTVTAGRESIRTAEELTKLADLLNKAAQAGAILRRGDYRSKKNLGAFERKKKKGKTVEEVIKLQNAVIKDPRMYATVLAHEMSHAIEYNINGNTNSTYKLFGQLTVEEERQIDSELKEIVDELEGKDIAAARADYFYKPTEMFARYIETLVLHPGKAEKIAPLVTDKFGQLVVSEPLVADFLAALDSSLDKGYKNYTPDFLKDMRQMYRKHLGKRAGDVAYGAELIRRAEIQRSEKLIDQLVKRKFKDVKDEPALLFRAAEAILVTENGEPQFGTHDFVDSTTAEESEKLKAAGWEFVGHSVEAGQEIDVFTRQRYTPAEAKKIFEKLSPEGQQLIKDFTAAKEEAKDEFNRELMKELYHIDSKLEGWVHHFFEGKPMAGNKKASLRTKVAGAKKKRRGAEGYIEDFQKATEKALLELDRAEINNGFIRDQLARISKPIAKGAKPDPGWVEVVADEKGGLRLPGEGMQVIIKSDNKKALRVPQKRYQVPRDLAEHYREIRDLPAEANLGAKLLNRAAKYWTINVLIHPGSTSTNFFSGALQYSAKIMNDFYLDLFTANFGMERTRRNLIAPIQALTPRGWSNAPDWMFGGYRATQAGQYATGNADTKLDRGIDAYGNKALKLFSMVDVYWKRVIALSEGGKMSAAASRRITQRLQKEEKEILVQLNEAVDMYAFDYDNKPLWLSRFDRSGGKILKPFMTYPYKLVKFYTSHLATAFDRSQPWQVRTSKLLTIATIVSFIALLYKHQEDDQETPKGTEKTPLFLSPGGRVFVGKSGVGEELFVRTAKYPFFNLTSMGRAIVDRNGKEASDILVESFGTVGPGVELFMLATGRTDQFSQYTPKSVKTAEIVGSFLPAFRIGEDIGRMIDTAGRKPKTFLQGIGSQLPVWGSEEMRAKMRGDKRTVKIPDEPEGGRSIAGSARTVTTRGVSRPASDTLMSLLTGIYVRRIDPKEARQQELREIRDDAEDKIRSLLEQGQEADARTLGEEYGLTIPDSVYRYYRNKRKKS